MTITHTTPALPPAAADCPLLHRLLARPTGLTARQPRLTERALRDIGLHQSDIDWLHYQGSSQEAATGLAIRASRRSDNW